MKYIKTYESFLFEKTLDNPSSASLQDCKAIFTSYANVTNNKSSLQRLHKRKNEPFVKAVLDGQTFSSGPLYRGIVNWDDLPFKTGDKASFGFDGWSDDINVAAEFTGLSSRSTGKRIVFVMNDVKGAFINLKSFGDSLEKQIKLIRPDYDFENLNLKVLRAAAEKDAILEKLFDLYQAAKMGKYGRGESETITEPQSLKVLKVEENKINIPKLSLTNEPVKFVYV